MCYEERFPNRRIPNPKTFASVFQCLRLTGSFPSCSYSVEKQEERRIAHEEDVIQQAQRSSGISTRRISNRIGLPQSSVWRILNKENLYPYHFSEGSQFAAWRLCTAYKFLSLASREPS